MWQNQQIHEDGDGVTLASFYRFTDLGAFRELRAPLLEMCAALRLRGTILLAPEGINGTVAGERTGVQSLLLELARTPGLEGLEARLSVTAGSPFRRMKVKLRREIVSMGVPAIAPHRRTGTRVGAKEWNELLREPSMLVLDTRNDYEHRIGTFPRARSPGTGHFREFPAWADDALDPARHRRIAMFCTGGIRCEKASAYLIERGFEEVFQLAGGILGYFGEIPAGASLWQGECFVFDARVALDGELGDGRHVQCYACRQPLSQADRASPHYQPGVSCPYCHANTTGRRRRAFAERSRQVRLAAQRGERHVGAVMGDKRRGARKD